MAQFGTPPVDRLRVVLVDDSEVMIEIIGEFLGDHTDIEVVGAARTVEAALALVEAVQPRVVLMDARLPDGSGAEATRRIRARWPEVDVLFLTSDASRRTLDEAAASGAVGYLLKPEDLDRLADVLRGTDAGGCWPGRNGGEPPGA